MTDREKAIFKLLAWCLKDGRVSGTHAGRPAGPFRRVRTLKQCLRNPAPKADWIPVDLTKARNWLDARQTARLAKKAA